MVCESGQRVDLGHALQAREEALVAHRDRQETSDRLEQRDIVLVVRVFRCRLHAEHADARAAGFDRHEDRGHAVVRPRRLRIERPPGNARPVFGRSEELRDAGAHRFPRPAGAIDHDGRFGPRRTVIVHVLDLQCGTGA